MVFSVGIPILAVPATGPAQSVGRVCRHGGFRTSSAAVSGLLPFSDGLVLSLWMVVPKCGRTDLYPLRGINPPGRRETPVQRPSRQGLGRPTAVQTLL